MQAKSLISVYNDSKLAQGRDAAKQVIKDNPELAAELEAKIMDALTNTSEDVKQAIEAKKKAEAKSKKDNEKDDDNDELPDMDFDADLPDDFKMEED